jgi:hypothetical protein
MIDLATSGIEPSGCGTTVQDFHNTHKLYENNRRTHAHVLAV